MTLLNIFAVEDTKEEIVVISLPEGEHIIGRGVTLNCNDKRISRKHALINVGKEVVTIKAVHVNPCFFKAADGNSITILPKNTAVELNDGDQFALLADLFWFRVRVIVDGNVVKCNDVKKPENISCNKILTVNDSTNIVTSPANSEINMSTGNNNFSSKGKHSLEENLMETCKRQRITHENKNEPSTSNSPDKNISQHEDTSNGPSSLSSLNLLLNTSRNLEQNIGSNQLINNLNNILQEDYGTTNSEKEKETVTNNLKLNNRTVKNALQNEGNTNTKKLKYSETEEKDRSKEEQLEIISDNEAGNSIIIDENVMQIEETDKNQKIKEDKIQGSETGDKIKKENVDTLQSKENEDGNAKNKNDQNEASCSKDNPEDQQNKKKSRRERCWYAHKCYRKNPLHRVNFSHPGDDDFLSDPEDDRPVCPFGDGCYRTNLHHRRQYKHTNRPAPKPSKVNIQLHNFCSFCPHCNKNGNNKTDYESDYESDYEY